VAEALPRKDSLQEILKRFEKALDEQDLLAVRMSVEQLLRFYVPKSASGDLRRAIHDLLIRKAAESSNRALTAYLRSVAACIADFARPSGADCAEDIKAPVPKQQQQNAPLSPNATPTQNSLGKFLDTRREKASS
jgi:hypothetical protein